MDQLAEKGILTTALLSYAIAIRVPIASQDELTGLFGGQRGPNDAPVDGGESLGSKSTMGNFFALMPDQPIDAWETFAAGEDPVEYVMNALTCAPPRESRR